MFNLIWKGEVVDSFTTREEAEDMAVEYRLAYGGAVNVKEVEEDDYVDVEDNYEDDGDWMDADALASAGFGTDEDYGSYGGDEW
ncbi:MAG: hypothetical protein CBC05_01945 [Crocinitomicaceae bacterium TMED45]|nr:MAG: hypothetical protein CBC05_02620 [Crocinitomicaceae bacterium TMED45]OUU18650.1 MAG: hypothetical protein CBC05_01945 [Crocinitomicaceae bacterium TMED45]|tara:strand:- start:746 stop:997 length:252 start_codon:yes stop_codon:yes gene_type:complete